MDLKQLNAKINAINPIKSFEEFANDNPTIFLNSIKEQMYSGQLGIPYARKSTTEWKLSNNPSAGGKMDFYVSGNMFKGMYLKQEQQGFYIDSNVSYTEKLQEDYPQMWIFSSETKEQLTKDIIENGFKDYLI